MVKKLIQRIVRLVEQSNKISGNQQVLISKVMKNIYNQYLLYLQSIEVQTLNENPHGLEKHHVLPLHDGGKKTCDFLYTITTYFSSLARIFSVWSTW